MLIGVDIGTTYIKAAAFDENGRLLASVMRSNPVLSPQPGWQEQDPEALYRQVKTVLNEILQKTPAKDGVDAIAFSAAMHGLIAVDDRGRPLTNALLWSDLRATEIARRWREDGTAGALYRASGVPVHPMSPLCKIAWLREHRPGIFAETHKFLGIKDFILYRLCGEYVCELSSASATGLLDLHAGEWSVPALEAVGIGEDRLPRLVSPYHRLDMRPHGLRIVAGASDGCLANLGAGAMQPGDAALTIGTSGAFRVCSNQPLLDAEGRTFCYRLDEQTFVAGGATNNGGNVLQWLGELFSPGKPVDGLLRAAETLEAGADGLMFLPYIYGERAPVWDPASRGVFQGLRASHTPAHFVRAAMEGVLYNLQWISELAQTPQAVARIFATGGFTANAAWLQMAADIFDCEVLTPDIPVDASVFGAVQLSRKALGLPPWPAAAVGNHFFPDKNERDVYASRRSRFRQMWAAIQTH